MLSEPLSVAPSETISVLLTVFNGEAFLQETLDCLRKNRQDIFEIIVIDDASRDRSPAIIEANRSLFDKVIVHPENKGVARTRQEGVQLSRGDWIHILDQDDLIPTGFYARARALFPEADLIISEMEILNSVEQRIYRVIDLRTRSISVESFLLQGSPAPTPSQVLGRRALFARHRFMPYPGSDDADFLLRTMATKPRSRILWGSPIYWRWHRGNSSFQTLTKYAITSLLERFVTDFPEYRSLLRRAQGVSYRYAAVLSKKAGKPWVKHAIRSARCFPRAMLSSAGLYLLLPEALKFFFRRLFGKKIPECFPP